MKKILSIICITLVTTLAFTACSSSSKSNKIEVDIENGVFQITPQEFIDGFNDLVKQFQKTSDNQIIQYLLMLPNFVESDSDMEIDDGLQVTYITGADDKLKKLEIMYSDWASNEATMTFSFWLGALPAYFNPESSLNLGDEFNLPSDSGTGSTIDGEVSYSYVAMPGSIFITIEAVHLEKKS